MAATGVGHSLPVGAGRGHARAGHLLGGAHDGGRVRVAGAPRSGARRGRLGGPARRHPRLALSRLQRAPAGGPGACRAADHECRRGRRHVRGHPSSPQPSRAGRARSHGRLLQHGRPLPDRSQDRPGSVSAVDIAERLRSWTYRRQGMGRAGREPLEVLRSIVGVYSTHPTAPLALAARCAGLQPKEFTDMEQRRQVVRLPAMRQSAFLLPTDTAERVFAATRVPLEKHAGRLRFGGLTFDAYARLTPRVVECLTTPSTPAELRRCFPTQDDVYMVARVLAREGKVLRVGGSLRTDQLKYVATEAWLGRPLDDVDPHEALTWLAAEYLRAFGPARAADFAWWAGATRRAASAALAQLETTEREHGLVMLEENREAFDHVQPVDPEAVDVLPKWDSYTMAYAPAG